MRMFISIALALFATSSLATAELHLRPALVDTVTPRPAPVPVSQRLFAQYTPCEDGRYSNGRPMTCAEILDEIDRGDAYDRRPSARRLYRSSDDPCRDGRYNTGRARTCGEVMQDVYRRQIHRPRNRHPDSRTRRFEE